MIKLCGIGVIPTSTESLEDLWGHYLGKVWNFFYFKRLLCFCLVFYSYSVPKVKDVHPSVWYFIVRLSGEVPGFLFRGQFFWGSLKVLLKFFLGLWCPPENMFFLFSVCYFFVLRGSFEVLIRCIFVCFAIEFLYFRLSSPQRLGLDMLMDVF